MCRLFGLVANREVDVKFSMLEASNRFKNQGEYNPHGWGIGWYENGIARIFKRGENAFYSSTFNEKVKEIKSKIVIAHVRYASSGSSYSDNNAHPFLYENWIFAHNGTINQKRISSFLKAPYNQNFSSEPIDSEVYFRFLLQSIDEEKDIIEGLKKAIREVIKDCNGANFLLSNGENLYAFRFGKSLYYLERDPFDEPMRALSKETQMLLESKKIANEKAVIIATEKITPDEKWKELKDNLLLVCDKKLKISQLEVKI